MEFFRYVPARTNWTANGVGPPPSRSPHNSPPPQGLPISPSPVRPRKTSETYYEDVDPRFSQDYGKNMPTILVPGGGPRIGEYDQLQHHPGIQPSASYESIQDGPLSESSHFTSISERGVNPQWQTEQQQQRNQYGMGGIPNRQPQGPALSHQRDFLLTGNPDFEIGGGRGNAANRGSRSGATPVGGMI